VISNEPGVEIGPCPPRLGILAKKITDDPRLSPAAAQAARDQVRTFEAAVMWFEKALAYQEQNRLERARRTLSE
jgi:hypothetical protein